MLKHKTLTERISLHMDARKRTVEELEREIGRLERQLTAESVEIGRRIAGIDTPSLNQPEFHKYLSSIRALQRSVEDAQKEETRLKDLDARATGLERQIEANLDRIREAARERDARLPDVGAGAYAFYRTLSQREDYAPLFDSVLKLDAQIDRFASDLATAEHEEKEKGFFEKLRLKTRKVLLRGNIHKVEKQKLKAYAEAGGRVVDSDFSERISGELRTHFDYVRQRNASIRSLEEQNLKMHDEISAIRNDLRQAGAVGGFPAWQKTQQKRLEDIHREQEVLFGWMGQFYLERDLRTSLPDSNLRLKFDVVSGIRASIVKRREQISRLKAELEMEELQKSEKTLQARRKQLDEELRLRERQGHEIDIQLAAGTRRIEQLRKILSGEAPYSEPDPLPPTPDFYRPAPSKPPASD